LVFFPIYKNQKKKEWCFFFFFDMTELERNGGKRSDRPPSPTN